MNNVGPKYTAENHSSSKQKVAGTISLKGVPFPFEIVQDAGKIKIKTPLEVVIISNQLPLASDTEPLQTTHLVSKVKSRTEVSMKDLSSEVIHRIINRGFSEENSIDIDSLRLAAKEYKLNPTQKGHIGVTDYKYPLTRKEHVIALARYFVLNKSLYSYQIGRAPHYDFEFQEGYGSGWLLINTTESTYMGICVTRDALLLADKRMLTLEEKLKNVLLEEHQQKMLAEYVVELKRNAFNYFVEHLEKDLVLEQNVSYKSHADMEEIFGELVRQKVISDWQPTDTAADQFTYSLSFA